MVSGGNSIVTCTSRSACAAPNGNWRLSVPSLPTLDFTMSRSIGNLPPLPALILLAVRHRAPRLRINLQPELLLGVGEEEEAEHHLLVRLEAPANGRRRIGVVGVEDRVVVVRDALQFRPL